MTGKKRAAKPLTTAHPATYTGKAMDVIPTPNSPTVKIGARLAIMGKTRGWLCEQLGTQRNMGQVYELKTLDMVIRVSKLLGVSPAWLMDADQDVSEGLSGVNASEWAVTSAHLIAAMIADNLDFIGLAARTGIDRDDLRYLDRTSRTRDVLVTCEALDVRPEDLFVAM